MIPNRKYGANSASRGRIKCLVWDLDNTLWQGVLSEGEAVSVLPAVRLVVETLERRGILQSIASKNSAKPAMQRLRELGLADYFLYPQVNWGPKSLSIEKIAIALNIGLDTVAFVDDQQFERDEVAFSFAEVLCFDASDLPCIIDLPELNPRYITDESSKRRQMYLLDAQRIRDEENFVGPKEAFLASLGMVFSIAPALESDLQRLEELTARTNQLNTTGRIYTHEELGAFRRSPRHVLLAAALNDKYGTYGKIGLALLETQAGVWTIKLMLMSCRVMSRGVGTVLLLHVMRMAQAAGADLRAEIVLNDRNRMMYMTYRFAGFTERAKQGEHHILEHDLQQIPESPKYLELDCPALHPGDLNN